MTHLQEENNNSVSNQQSSINDDTFNHNQLLQSLTATQQNTTNHNDNNDSLLALTVALRSVTNVSPLAQQNLSRHLSHNRNFTATNPLLTEKLLSPNLNDLDNLTISNRPHRPPDLKGK